MSHPVIVMTDVVVVGLQWPGGQCLLRSCNPEDAGLSPGCIMMGIWCKTAAKSLAVVKPARKTTG